MEKGVLRENIHRARRDEIVQKKKVRVTATFSLNSETAEVPEVGTCGALSEA